MTFRVGDFVKVKRINNIGLGTIEVGDIGKIKELREFPPHALIEFIKDIGGHAGRGERFGDKKCHCWYISGDNLELYKRDKEIIDLSRIKQYGIVGFLKNIDNRIYIKRRKIK